MTLSSKDFKVPQTLGKDFLYSEWTKEIRMMETFTSLPNEKMTPGIFMALSGETREAVLNMDNDALTARTGVKNVLIELDKMYLKMKALELMKQMRYLANS